MKEKVLTTIQKYKLIENGDKLVLGVSGGPDSMCMLDILNKLKKEKKLDFEFVVTHINHQIREEAKDDEKYVENYCTKNKIKYYIKSIDVKQYANNNKIGLEEAGRNLRYKFFDEVINLTNSNKIAIAHNENDKIETIIMNFLRGSGLSGLEGIKPIRDNKYIRPLIQCKRSEIEEYCEENKLNPRIDKTNFQNDYTRNKIRNIVLPYIEKEFNQNIVETINRFSEIVTETEEYMQKTTEKIYNTLLIKENEKQIILNLKIFNTQDIIIRKRIILYSINKVLGNVLNIEKVNIEDLIKLCENNVGNKYITPNKNIKVSINKGKIFFDALN